MGDFQRADQTAMAEEDQREQQRIAEQEGPRPFRLKTGVTTVRILPPWRAGIKDWYYEFAEYNLYLGGQWHYFTAPAFYGLPDPVAEKRAELLELGGESNLTAAGKLRAKRQFLYNVLVHDAPAGVEFTRGQVYVLKTGVRVKRQLRAIDGDSQRGAPDITNHESGVNVCIQSQGTGRNTEYQVYVRPEPRSSLADYCLSVGVQPIGPEHLHQLDKLYPPKSEAEIRQLLTGLQVGRTTAASAPTQVQVPSSFHAPQVHTPAPVVQQAPAPAPVQQAPAPAPVQQTQTYPAGPNVVQPTPTVQQQPVYQQPQPVYQERVQQPVQQQPVYQQPVQQQPVQVVTPQAQQPPQGLPPIPAPPPDEQGNG